MVINYYVTPAGNSPVEKYIDRLPKLDQAKFAEVFEGIEKFGLEFFSAEIKPLKGKIWEIARKKVVKALPLFWYCIKQATEII